jgi:ferric-dicitrate binding protein FerR (iron transport regulator)
VSRLVDELEERRVMRRLAGLAAAVPDLADAELHRLVTARPVRGRRRRSPARYLPAVAACAVVAIGVSVQLDRPAPRPSSTIPGSTELVTFPQGTALQLLLAPGPRDKA